MANVTKITNLYKQPRGGFLNPKDLTVIQLSDKEGLWPKENLPANIMGVVIDYMTRFMICKNAKVAFKYPLIGASMIMESDICEAFLMEIKGLDDDSLFYACKVAGYDAIFRAGLQAYVDIDYICPDERTLHNVRIMVKRCLAFFRDHGPVVSMGFTFDGAYTKTITKGDGDYLTRDTLWDLKVSVNSPTSKNTFQLLVYAILAKHSRNPLFKALRKIGIYNPRLNCVYLYNLSKVPTTTIKEIESEVIGY